MGIRKFVRLLPIQIPQFWNEIKLAIVKSNAIEQDLIQKVLVEYLSKLLSEKSQCFIAIDNENKLSAIMITTIAEVSVSSNKYLLIDAFYSISKLSDEDVKEMYSKLVTFARNNRCNEIKATTSIERVKYLLSLVGAKEIATVYLLKL